MASSIQPKSKQQYVDFDEYIDYQLQKTRSNIKATDILTALVGVAVLVLGYVLLFVVFDHWVIAGGFSQSTRLIMLSGVFIAAVTWIGWKVVVPYLKRVTGLYAAREIEKFDPDLKSNLLNLIDLRQSGREISEEVRTSLEKRAAVTLSHVNIEEVVDRRPLMQTSYALLAVIVLWCAYSLFSEKTISSSVLRALFPAANVEVATQTKFLEVKPGDVEIPARTQLKVTADLSHLGDDVPKVRLYYSSADGQFLDEPIAMRPDEEINKRFHCVITGENGRGILQNLTYRIESGDARTREFEITVVQSPSATVDSVRYEYPSYMDLPGRTQQGGHIDTWEGSELDESRVTISATANMPVTSARLLFSDTEDMSQRAEERTMQIVDGTKLTVTLDREIRFRSDGTYPHYYRIECRTEQRRFTKDPTLYSFKIRPDKRPVVELLDPVRDLERPVNAVVPLLIRAHDPDFKLRSVTLRIEKNGERLPVSIPLFDGKRKSFGTTYRWKLDGGEFDLKPGDTVTYWIEVRDNKPPTGNRTNTRRMKIDLIAPASPEDVQEQLKQDEQRQQEKLEEQAEQNSDDKQSPNQEDSQQGDAGDSQQPGENSDQKDQQEPGKEGTQQKDSASKPDGNKDGQKQTDPQQQPGDSPQQNGEKGEGKQESFDPDGADDQEVTKKLLQKFEKEQQEKQQQNNDPSEEKNEPGAGDDPNENPMQDQSQDPNGPKQKNQQPGDETGQPGTGEKGTPQDKQGAGEQSSEDGNSDNKQTGGKKPTDPNAESNGNKKQQDQPSDGKKTPADDATNAQPQKATGDEKGMGTPDKNPKADPTQSKDPNNIKRNPDENPALKKKDGSDTSQKPADLGDKTKKGTPNAGKKGSQNPDKTGKKQNEDNKNPDGSKSKSPQPMDNKNQSPLSQKKSDVPQGNEDLKGPGQPKGNNKDNKQGGEGGSKKPSDQGNSGSKQSGSGDPTAKQGKSQPSEKSTDGKSDGKQGDGSKTGDGQNKKGSDPSKAGKKSSGKSGSKSGGSKGGSKGGTKGGGKGGKGAGKGKSGKKGGASPTSGGSPASGGTGGSKSSSSGGGDEGSGSGEFSPDDANADYSKKAANLVLKRLENELQRGKVDKKLLDELGWSENEMKKFTERLRNNLREDSENEAPQSKAGRLQFQEWLKNLDLKSTGRKRTAGNLPKRQFDEVQGRRTPPPAEYRDLFEAYTRGLNRRIKNQSKKK